MDGGGVVIGPPVPPSPLIGRAHELAVARRLLGEVRLLTLVGTGGAGKTRLVIEIAEDVRADFPDGVCFVDLASLTDPDAVEPAIARALGLRAAGPQALDLTLHGYLAARRTLLVLDTMEHLLGAAPAVARLLAGCRGLRVLTTSRAPLQIPGEHLLPVEPLPVPDPRVLPGLDELAAASSVALFVARLQSTQPGFVLSATTARTVAEICVRLDGLPLALELAAARARAVGLDELLVRMRDRFRLLELPDRAVPPRHRTLAGAVGWSVELLDGPAERLFRRLSVFVGGWTADAAQFVCGDGEDVLPAVAALVEQSLVVATAIGTGVRYRMLDTMREFAAGMLHAAGERDRYQRRHVLWCVNLAERIGAGFLGDDEPAWLDRAEADYDNLQAAIASCRAGDDVELGLRITGALFWFWDVRGYLGTGRGHLERLLARPESKRRPAVRARALDALGRLTMSWDEHPIAQALLRESAALAHGIGDPDREAWSLSTIVMSGYMTGDLDSDLAEHAVALAAEGGTPYTIARCTFALGLVRWGEQRRNEGRALLAQSLAMVPPRARWARGRTLYFLGLFAHLDGDDVGATDTLRESAQLLLGIGDRRSLVDCLDVMACVAARTGRSVDAVRLFAAGHRIRAETGVGRHHYLHEECAAAERAARSALGSAIADRVAGDPVPLGQLVGGDDTRRPAGVTEREFEVAGLIAAGLTNRLIGRRLGISERTAGRHAENLRGKLGVRSRAEIATWVASPE